MGLSLLLLALTMSAGRIDHDAIALPDGRVAIVGGTEQTRSVDVIDAGRGAVITIEDATIVPVAGAATTALPDGRLLLTGGSYTRERHIHGGTWGNDRVDTFDAVAGYVGSAGRLKHARTGHEATLLADGRVLITGGYVTVKTSFIVQRHVTNSAEIFDPATGTSRTVGSMQSTRFGHTATLLGDGRVLIAGGAEHQPYPAWATPAASTEIFDPITETFSPGPAMATPRIEHTATLLDDGRVLIAGGRTWLVDALAEISSEIFDPTTGAIGRGPDLGRRAGHTATRLLDGRILFFGGADDAVVYDPKRGVVVSRTMLETARRRHAATLLPDGTVMISGGTVDGSRYLDDVLLFVPSAPRRRAARP